MLSGERKKFGLRSARVIRSLHTCLAHTAIGRGDDMPATFKINFDDAFVEFVGKTLPKGVGPYTPAYIIVTREHAGWLISAAYVLDKEQPETPLWRTTEAPTWVPEKKDGNNSIHANPADHPRRDYAAFRAYQASLADKDSARRRRKAPGK